MRGWQLQWPTRTALRELLSAAQAISPLFFDVQATIFVLIYKPKLLGLCQNIVIMSCNINESEKELLYPAHDLDPLQNWMGSFLAKAAPLYKA